MIKKCASEGMNKSEWKGRRMKGSEKRGKNIGIKKKDEEWVKRRKWKRVSQILKCGRIAKSGVESFL
jgi:hypothetical protein